MRLTKDDAMKILKEYNESDALIKHALQVSAAMEHFGHYYDGDAEMWSVVGLLHDVDYEKFPDEHCTKASEILKEHNVDEDYIHAVMSHGYGICSDVCPENIMEKTLYAVDELTGLINAACLMRPSKSILDLETKSLNKKFKQSSFAAGVNRDIILKGAEMMGIELQPLMDETIKGLSEQAEVVGLKGNL